MARITLIAALGLCTLACSKADAPTTPPTDAAAPQTADAEATPGHEHTKGEAHEHDFPAAVTTYHDTMAPLWHAEPGEARTSDTCDAVADLIAKAEVITGAEAPEKVEDPEAWSAAGAELVAKTQALQATCSESPDGFDASFHEVHEAFHALVKLVGHEKQG